jgi:hypothetical protein
MMSRKLLIATFIGALLVIFGVHLLDFPGSVPDFQRASGGGTLLDAIPSFSEEETYRRVADYGEEGRKNYAFRNLTVDVLLPLAVFPFLLLFMLHALERYRLGRPTRALFLALPVVYLIFDFAENGLVLVLLANFPDRLHIASGILPYVTVVKRAASILALLIPAAIFLVSLIRRATR